RIDLAAFKAEREKQHRCRRNRPDPRLHRHRCDILHLPHQDQPDRHEERGDSDQRDAFKLIEDDRIKTEEHNAAERHEDAKAAPPADFLLQHDHREQHREGRNQLAGDRNGRDPARRIDAKIEKGEVKDANRERDPHHRPHLPLDDAEKGREQQTDEQKAQRREKERRKMIEPDFRSNEGKAPDGADGKGDEKMRQGHSTTFFKSCTRDASHRRRKYDGQERPRRYLWCLAFRCRDGCAGANIPASSGQCNWKFGRGRRILAAGCAEQSMDSVTQFLLGASISGALLGPRIGAKSLLIGGLVATLPDLDAFIPYDDPIDRMTHHRGFSHSLIVQTMVTPVITLAVAKIVPAARAHLKTLLATIWLVLVTHSLLDALTTYGTQLFWPLQVGPPVAFPAIFIIDPIYSLL